MLHPLPRFLLFCLFVALSAGVASGKDPVDPASVPQSEKPPHPVKLVFYLSGLGGGKDAAAINQSVGALKTVTAVKVNARRAVMSW